jgi:acyl-CoA thioesterase FadM
MPAVSDAASPAEFLFRTRIRFHQADPAGVLFFGRVTELLQAAYEELVADMGLDHRAHFAQHETSTPIAHLEIDYHRPIQAGEDITVRVRVARIGSRSFTLAFGLDDEDGQRRVSAETVFVFTLIEGERFLPAPLPEDLRARLARYRVVDSA